LEGKSFSIIIGSFRMRRPLIGGEDFETSIGQRKQVQGTVMEAYQEREVSWVGKRKEKKD